LDEIWGLEEVYIEQDLMSEEEIDALAAEIESDLTVEESLLPDSPICENDEN
jgi:hypothetical protein